MDLFAETAPPPQSIIKYSDDYSYFDNSQISIFKEQLLSSLNSIQPRLDSLEQSLLAAENNISNIPSETSSEFDLKLQDLQDNMPTIHQTSINLTRRIQNVSLKVQEASTIAAPKVIKPIIDEFYTLKADFNKTLKDIAKTTIDLNEKVEKKSKLVKNASKDLKSLQIMKADIEKSIIANKQNSLIIDELKERLLVQARDERIQILDDFDKSLTEAENLVSELESLAEKGLTDSNEKVMKLQNDQYDINSSFNSLSRDIEKTMNTRINELRSRIDKNTERDYISIQEINLSLTKEIDRIMEAASESPPCTLLDKIEEKRQSEELDVLLNRIEKLKKDIIDYRYNSSKILSNFAQSTSRSLEDEKQETQSKKSLARTITTKINGEKKKIVCYGNGTFKIQDK